MAGQPDPADARRQALAAWLAAQFDGVEFTMAPGSADASFRRYFRVGCGGNTWMAMDAPPAQEDSRPFVRVAALLREAGVHAPSIEAMDLERGFLLLEDLGDQTYLDVLDDTNADRLFSHALDALVAWQSASRPGVLPAYDADTLRRELALFPDWYLERHLGVRLGAAERRDLGTGFERIVEFALAQPRVYVHRDFMPRNLVPSRPDPGVVDFQDARHGPITYDPISLFKDAFVSWPEARVAGWLAEYGRRARAAGLPVPRDDAALHADCDWMGLQRHLKVIGIFARICHRDGKPQYLADVPRFAAYVRPVLERYPELAPLRGVIERYLAPEAVCAR